MTLSPASSRGVPPTFECIRFPIAFDTPGLVPTTYPLTAWDTGIYPITAVDVGGAGDGSFTIAGDHTAAFPVASVFTVTGSTGNDGPYTVVSTSVAAGHTTIEVTSSLNDATPDGSVVSAIQTITVAGNRTAAFAPGVPFSAILAGGAASPTSVVSAAFGAGVTVVVGLGTFLGEGITYVSAVVPVGATVYTPTVGDILLGNDDAPLTLVTVGEAWNGSTPKIKVLTEAMRQALATPFVDLDALVADDPSGVSLALSASPFPVGTNWRLWRFVTADPILAQVDDGNGLDPGSTQGAAEILLLLIPAA